MHNVSGRSLNVCLWLAAFAIGCGSQEKLYQVSGTVGFNGEPIPAGLIYFDPDATQGTAGTQGFAKINNGQYTTAEEGQGVRGGKYVVRILGYDGHAANEAPLGQALFEEYKETKDIPPSDTQLDFDVPAATGR